MWMTLSWVWGSVHYWSPWRMQHHVAYCPPGNALEQTNQTWNSDPPKMPELLKRCRNIYTVVPSLINSACVNWRSPHGHPWWQASIKSFTVQAEVKWQCLDAYLSFLIHRQLSANGCPSGPSFISPPSSLSLVLGPCYHNFSGRSNASMS